MAGCLGQLLCAPQGPRTGREMEEAVYGVGMNPAHPCQLVTLSK